MGRVPYKTFVYYEPLLFNYAHVTCHNNKINLLLLLYNAIIIMINIKISFYKGKNKVICHMITKILDMRLIQKHVLTIYLRNVQLIKSKTKDSNFTLNISLLDL